jgi:hypothetical protein
MSKKPWQECSTEQMRLRKNHLAEMIAQNNHNNKMMLDAIKQLSIELTSKEKGQ